MKDYPFVNLLCLSDYMDFGNSSNTWQVLLSTIGKVEQPASKRYATVAALPMVMDEFATCLEPPR